MFFPADSVKMLEAQHRVGLRVGYSVNSGYFFFQSLCADKKQSAYSTFLFLAYTTTMGIMAIPAVLARQDLLLELPAGTWDRVYVFAIPNISMSAILLIHVKRDFNKFPFMP